MKQKIKQKSLAKDLRDSFASKNMYQFNLPGGDSFNKFFKSSSGKQLFCLTSLGRVWQIIETKDKNNPFHFLRVL